MSKKYIPMQRLNGAAFEPDNYLEWIEADNAVEALEIYIEEISDNLRAVEAVRIYNAYSYNATFIYDGVVLELKCEEMENEF